MSKQFRYKHILLYSSLQFTGNIEEYFSEHSQKMVSYIIVPRAEYKNNLVRLYRFGKLVEEHRFTLSQNIVVYYILILYYQLRFLCEYFDKGEIVAVITFHPISFFAMTMQKLIRKIIFVYWVADYFPPVNTPLKLFEKLKAYYNKRVDYVCYLSDAINKIMNGVILHSDFRKTVMWGIIPKVFVKKILPPKISMLFVGVIRQSQGLEQVFKFLKSHKNYLLTIIGDCDPTLYKKYQKIIHRNNIEKNVYFPNKFYSLQELEFLSRRCHIGVALYDTDPTSATYYTDPGKVKTYTQMGLPVIMTDTSAISKYITKYKAGIVVKQSTNALYNALIFMQKNYDTYQEGVRKFNTFFSYDKYYGKAFKFLEHYD